MRWINRRNKQFERLQYRFGFCGCEVLIASMAWCGDLWYAVVGVPNVEYENQELHTSLLKRLREEWHFFGAMHEFEYWDMERMENMDVFIVVCNRAMDRYQRGSMHLPGTLYRNHLYVAEETKRVIAGLPRPKYPRDGFV